MYLVKLGELLVLEIQRLGVSCCSHWEHSCLFEIAALQSKKSHIKLNPTLCTMVLDEVTPKSLYECQEMFGLPNTAIWNHQPGSVPDVGEMFFKG